MLKNQNDGATLKRPCDDPKSPFLWSSPTKVWQQAKKCSVRKTHFSYFHVLNVAYDLCDFFLSRHLFHSKFRIASLCGACEWDHPPTKTAFVCTKGCSLGTGFTVLPANQFSSITLKIVLIGWTSCSWPLETQTLFFSQCVALTCPFLRLRHGKVKVTLAPQYWTVDWFALEACCNDYTTFLVVDILSFKHHQEEDSFRSAYQQTSAITFPSHAQCWVASWWRVFWRSLPLKSKQNSDRGK